MQATGDTQRVTLYRMVLPDHECPYGRRALEMLEQRGFEVDEHRLESREATDAFKAEHGVATTPQAFVEGKRIGGSEELERWLDSRG